MATPFLGLSLATSLFCLFDTLLSPLVNAILCALLGIALSVLTSRSGQGERLNFPPLSKGQSFLLGFLALSTWIYSQGHFQLFPDIDYLLWDLTKGHPGERSALMASASLFAKDPWLSTLIFLGFSQVSVVLGAFALARLCLSSGRSGWVWVGVYLLGATEKAWLVFQTPAEIPDHLWGLSALFLIAMGKRYSPFLSLPILAALTLSNWVLALAILLVIPHWKKHSLAALGALGLLLSLYFKGFSLGLCVATVLLLYQQKRPDRLEPWTLKFSLLELLSPVSGLFGLTAFALEAGKKLESVWLESEPSKLQWSRTKIGLPKRAVLISAGLVIFWYGIDGAETVFNDSVLIGAQQEKVSLGKLVRPHSLQDWLEWRGAGYGFSTDDQRALEPMKTLEGQVVYLSGTLPDPRVSSLLAVASGKAFLGWTPSRQGPLLDQELALYLATGQAQALAGHPADLLLGPQLQALPVPQAPGHKRERGPLVHLEGPKGQPVSIDSLLRAKISGSQAREVPAASLIPIEIAISNPTNLALDLSSYRDIRFDPNYPNRKPLAPVDDPAAAVRLESLSPGEQLFTTAYLRTDNFPLNYDLKLSLSKDDGTYQQVQLEEPVILKSYRIELPLDLPPKEES